MALAQAVLRQRVVLVISQASSIHSFLSHLGLDIYCIIARNVTERKASPLTEQMRRSLENVLAQLLMSKATRNGGWTFLSINTHFLGIDYRCTAVQVAKKMLMPKHQLSICCYKTLTADGGKNIISDTIIQGTDEGR